MALFLLAAMLTVGASVPAAAAVPDSDAPRGASPNWLPDEECVMERWLPFDSGELWQTLGRGRYETYRFLHEGDKTLLDLARERNVDVRGLAARLVEARRPAVSARLRRKLVRRTRRVLTQGHLAEHLLGHHWHQDSLIEHFDWIVGGRHDQFQTLAANGRRHGVGVTVVRHRLLAVLAAAGSAVSHEAPSRRPRIVSPRSSGFCSSTISSTRRGTHLAWQQQTSHQLAPRWSAASASERALGR